MGLPSPKLKNLISLSFSAIAAAPPSTSCFLGKIKSHNSDVIWLRFTESWFNSISIPMEHLLNTKLTFLVTTQVGQNCWEPKARSRDLGIARQILRQNALAYTETKGWQKSQSKSSETCFPLVYGILYFQNGLRSDRTTTRHTESLNVESLQCVLWALELLICMKVHGTISPCNTLQCLKNQCPKAQKDEYRAFQLSFSLPEKYFSFQTDSKGNMILFSFWLRRCWVYARISTSSIPLGNGPLGKRRYRPWKHSRLKTLSLRAQWMRMR